MTFHIVLNKQIVFAIAQEGQTGSADVFLPDGESLPCYFVPSDPKHPDYTDIVHGVILSSKPAGKATFYPDDMNQLSSLGEMLKGAFMPDGMNMTGALSGFIGLQDSAVTIVLDRPPTEFAYTADDEKALYIWAPFLPPGTWMSPPIDMAKPPITSSAGVQQGEMEDDWGDELTEEELNEPMSETTEAPSKEPKKVEPPKEKKVAAFIAGLLFPGLPGSQQVFIPSQQEVPGILIPSDPNVNQISGFVTVNDTITALRFHSDAVTALQGLATGDGMFIPNGIAPGQGLVGTYDPIGPALATFTPDPPGKSYWYIQGKKENNGIWTPIKPAAKAKEQENPVVPLSEKKAFLYGVVIPGNKSQGIFIPDEGCSGDFTMDSGVAHGSYFPAVNGEPAFFIPDITNSIPNNTMGTFTPNCLVKENTASFPAKFVDRPPATLVVEQPMVKIWTNMKVKKTTKMSSTVLLSSDSQLFEAIDVMDGHFGYRTGDKGLDALKDPNSPVFFNYVKEISRQNHDITEASHFLILDDKSNTGPEVASTVSIAKQMYKEATQITLKDFFKYVDENYKIKHTKVGDDRVEVGVSKDTLKYVKKKKMKKLKININTDTKADASGKAGGAGSSGGKATSSISASFDGKKCKGFDSSANAVAKATNGSTAQSTAHVKDGGHANALSDAKDGSSANAAADVKNGGTANAASLAANGGNSSAKAGASNGATSNALTNAAKGETMGATANATQDKKASDEACGELGPDTINIESHAEASANGNGTGGAGSSATTNVKIDMAGIVSKLMAQIEEEDLGDDDEEERVISININSATSAGAMSGRVFGDDDTWKEDPTAEKIFHIPKKNGRSFAEMGKLKLLINKGWKTEFKQIKKGIVTDEIDEFYGLGSCVWSLPKIADLDSKNPNNVVDFYLKVMRNDCSSKTKVRLVRLFNEGLLKFDDDMKTMQVENLAKNDKPKIPESEMKKLYMAHEIETFTKTYYSRLTAEGPPNTLNSKSVDFLRDFTLKFIEVAIHKSPAHAVRLIRNLLTTLRTIITKLHYDYQQLKFCPKECTNDQTINHNDRVELMSLIQFTVHGLGPVFRKGADMKATYTAFFKRNREAIQARVKLYTLEFPDAIYKP